MKSINFEILRRQWPEMASLGGFAEHHTDRGMLLNFLAALFH